MIFFSIITLYLFIIGGAISQAKGAVTNWWSNLTTTQDLEDEKNTPVIQDI